MTRSAARTPDRDVRAHKISQAFNPENENDRLPQPSALHQCRTILLVFNLFNAHAYIAHSPSVCQRTTPSIIDSSGFQVIVTRNPRDSSLTDRNASAFERSCYRIKVRGYGK